MCQFRYYSSIIIIITCFLLDLINATDCSPNGAVQLVNGTEGTEGIVEYCYNGQWTQFCQFNDEEATVTCKQLGYAPYGSN